MKGLGKRMLAMLLSVMMVASVITPTAFADETTVENTTAAATESKAESESSSEETTAPESETGTKATEQESTTAQEPEKENESQETAEPSKEGEEPAEEPSQETEENTKESQDPTQESEDPTKEVQDPEDETDPVKESESDPAEEPSSEPAQEPESQPEDPENGGKKSPSKAPTKDGESEAETWTITFYNRDAEVHSTVKVEKGQAIGDALPKVIVREDYDAFWAVGEITEGSQGNEIKVTGDRIDGEFVPTADTVVVPDYDKIEYTVTFYKEDKATVVDTKKVTVDTSYSLNDIPAVPEKTGSAGKWVYSGGDFANTVSVKDAADSDRALSVWAEYEQNVFTVTYDVDGKTYATDTYYSGDELTLPADPVEEGKQFIGWFAGETQYNGGETVTKDLTLTAKFEDQYHVNFIVMHDDQEEERLSQYFRTGGETIGTMPQNPFVAGKVFEKWVIRGTDTEVTADTVVEGNMTVEAVFREVKVYNITAEYFYKSTTTPGKEVVFNTDLIQVEADELPYTITAPASTQTNSAEVAGGPVYYASTPSVEVKENDFDSEKTATVRIEYVEHTAEYDYMYMLKDLEGDGYTEIPDSKEHVLGVLHSTVTPTVKSFDFATLESAETKVITEAEGQVVKVFYNRKNFSLSYDTNGGSYVAGGTYKYGETVNLPDTNPTRTGYTFEGWYSDPELTNIVTGSVTINNDTTLYAKWTGEDVGYTIIYMKEVYDNATGTTSYVYENSRSATGTVGTTVYAANAQDITLNGYERNASMNGTASSAGTGADTAVVITADGSATLKVYYSLIRYTLVFNLNNNNGRITMNGQNYTGNNYKIENVVLGQDVSSMWPSNSDEVYSTATSGNRYFRYWTGAGNYVTKRYELVWDDVSNANSNHVMTFTASWTNTDSNRNAEYWLQQPDGSYAIASEYTQTGLNTTNLTAKEIDGYSKHSGTPNGYNASGNTTSTEQVWVEAFDDVVNDYGSDTRYNVGAKIQYNGHTYTITSRRNGGRWDWYKYYYSMTCHEDGHYEEQTVTTYTYRFYYDRAKYDILYNYNGNQINSKTDIYFEADISGAQYNYTPERPDGIDDDYTWGGWYADSALQNPYTFTKMPGHDLPLYAKWIAPEYTVSFELDGGTPVVESQTVEKYRKASAPGSTPAKDGYIFEGWYTSAGGDTLFDWNTQITADTTVYAHWTRATLEYTVHYVDEEGNAVASDKTVTNPNFTVGQEITEQAIAVAGYRPKKSSDTISLSSTNSDNVITFVYSEKAETTSYTVKYVIADGEPGAGTSVASDKIVGNVPGDTSSVIELAAAVDYSTLYTAEPELNGIEFFPDEVEKTCVLTADAEENVYTFYYSSFKNVKVQVNFVDMDGTAIADADTQVLKVGKTFTLSRTPISGWELNKAVKGTAYGDAEAAGSYKITESMTADGTLVFTLFYQKKVTVTANSLSKQYDGTTLTLPAEIGGQVKVEGLPEGESLTGIGFTYKNNDAEGGRLNAGTATVTPKDAVTDGNHTSSDYYTFRYISGTLEVKKINVTVRVEPDRWTGITYDGTEKKAGFSNGSKGINDYIMISHEGYKAAYQNEIWETIKALENVKEGGNGLGYYVEAQKDVCDNIYDLGLTQAMIPTGNGNYSVSLYVRPGRLQIVPKDVTVTTGSDSKTYDGTPLTKAEAAITGLVAADDGKVTVTATGTITDPGKADNTYTINWGDVKSGNYHVKDELGTLTVTEAALSVTVKDKTVAYNGSEQNGYGIEGEITGTGEAITTDAYTVTGLAEGDVLTVTYTPAAGTNAGTYTNGTFAETFKVMRGEEDVTAFYTAGTMTPGKLTIDPAQVTLTAVSDSKTYNGADQTITGFTSSVEGLTFEGVSASGTGKNVGEYDVTFTGVTVNETKDSTRNYVVTKTVDGKLNITKADLTITVEDQTYTYNGEAQGENNASYTDASKVTVTGLQGSDALTGIKLNGQETNVGVYEKKIVASEAAIGDATDNYNITYVAGKLTIEKAALTITVIDQTYTYNGEPQGEDNKTYADASKVTVTGLQGSDALTSITLNGQETNVGVYEKKIVASGAEIGKNTDNYDVTYVAGKLTITKAEVVVTITGNTDTKVYNGGEQSVEGYKVSINNTLYKEADISFSGSKTAKGTDVGEYPMGLKAEQFTNNNENFEVSFVIASDGKLNITPLTVKVTIVGNNSTDNYDGEAHTVTGYTATADSALYDVNADIAFDGTATATRTNVVEGEDTDGQTDMGLTKDQFTNNNKNFDVTFEVTADGYQKITPINVTVTITGHFNTTTYDGTEHSVSGYDVEISNPLYKGTDFTFNGTAAAARTDVGTTNMNLAKEQFENKNPNFAEVTFNVTDGYQTITPVEEVVVTITGHHDTKPYDGAEHSVSGYDVEISNPLYKEADFTFGGTAEAKRTEAGTTNMGLAAEQFVNNNKNFAEVTFNVTDGYQTIEPINVTVTITGRSNTTDYDGAEHSVSGYDVRISNPLYKESDFTFTGTATAARTDAGTTNMGLKAEQFTNKNTNFGTVTFEVTDGYQKIDPISVEVTITGANNTAPYDGEKHTVKGYTAKADNALYDVTKDFTFTPAEGAVIVEGEIAAEQTEVGRKTMGLSADQFENKNPNFSSVTFAVTDGYQEITPIDVTVTITEHSGQYDYDGKEHTVAGYDVTSIQIGGEDTTLYTANDFTFSGSDSVSGTNAGTYDMELTAADFTNTNKNFKNVTFVIVDGRLVINKINVTVTITENSDEVNYDGEEHTVKGYTAKADSDLYDVTKDFTFNGNDEVSGTNAGSYDMELKPEDFANKNQNFNTVTFVIVDGQLVISPISVTVTITEHSNKVDYDGASHTVKGYDVTSIQIGGKDTTLYTANDFIFNGNDSVSGTNAGSYDMELKAADFTNKNQNFTDVKFVIVDGQLVIDPIDVTVTITEHSDAVDYDGKAHTVTGYEAEASTELYDVTKDFTFNGNDSVSGTNAGSYDMELKAADFTNTNTNFAKVTFVIEDGQLVIKPIDVTVTITGNHASNTYDGEEHTVTGYEAEASTALYDVEKDFTFSGKAEAKRTEEGTTNMGLATEQFANTNPNFANVTFNVTDGYQTIVPIDEVVVTITGHNNTTDYDGEEHSVDSYDVQISNPLYKESDFTFSGTAEAKRTDAGTTNMGLAAEQFTNTNKNFAKVIFNVTDGYQTINPINVTVTVVGNNNTTDYDGEEHTVTGYTATADNALYDVTKDFTFSGTDEASRKDAGTTNMKLAAEQFANNNPNFGTVTFNVTDGYQTINPIDVTVTIVGASNSTDYDGKDHTVTGYTATADNALYDVTKDFTFSGQAEATRKDAGKTEMGLDAEQFKNTNPNFGTVTFNVTDGYQEIKPINVTVTIVGASNSTDYDGKDHTVTGYTATADNALYDVAKDFTFSGKAEATRKDAGKTEMGLDAEQFKNTNPNFATVTFNVTDGYQEIKPINVTVTITGAANTAAYDGQDHTVTGYTAEASTELYDVTKDFTFTPAADAVLVDGKISATRKDAGTTNMGLAKEQFANTNPNFATVTFEVTDGYQTITPIDVTVTIIGNTNTAVYDGTEHTVTGYEAKASTDLYKVTGDTVDFTFSGTAEAKRTEVGQTDMGLKAEQFANTNENFATVTFNVTDGYQKIDPIDEVTVTITGHTSTVDYDGQPHTVEGYDVEISNPLYTAADFTFTGTAKASRTDAGTTTMGLDENQFKNTNANFKKVTFVVTDGYQTVNPIDVTVTVVGAANTTDYDGEAHTVTGYTATASSTLYDVTKDFTFDGEATATRTDAGKTDMGLKAEQFTNTNKNFATVTFEVTDGYQEIKPIDVTVTITEHSDEVDYDGAAHEVKGYDVAISNPLYTSDDFTFSGTDTVSGTDAGTYPMELKLADFANKNENFANVTFEIVDGTLVIKPIDITVVLHGNTSTLPYDGADHTVTGYTVDSISSDLYTEADFALKVGKEATATQKDAGKKMMGLTGADFENKNDNFATVTFTYTDGYQEITPIDVTVVLHGNTGSLPYDGADHTVTGYTVDSISSDLYTEADFALKEGKEAKATRKDAGKTMMELTGADFENKNENFATVTFTYTDGYQEITPIDVTVTITGNHDTAVYDGAEHKVEGYDVEISNDLYTEEDFDFTGTAEAARTEEGTTKMGLAADQFTNNNENFATVTFNVTDGYQTITPVDEVVVTITGKTNTTDYDGAEHSVSGYDVEISNPLYKESDFTFSGTAAAARIDAGTTNMGLAADQFENTNKNFAKVTFNVTDGYQTITPIDVTVTIVGANNTTDYDGEEHKVEGYTATASTELYDVTKDFTFTGTDEAARRDAGTTNMGLAAEQFANKNANFANVTFNVTDGYQTINPINVTVTIVGANNTTDYDGEEHKVTGYTATASTPLYKVEGEAADFTFSGTAEAARRDTGKTNMGLAAEQFANKNDNFATVTFEVTDGYQEIKPIDVTVTITEHSDEVNYDGKAHTVKGYDVEISSPLYTEADFTFAGTDSVSGTDAGSYDMELTAADFTNNNENFKTVTFRIVDGQLVIKPIKVIVTITENSDEVDYDGEVHTVKGYTAKADSDLYDVTKDFTFNGNDEVSGTDAGTYDMELKAADFTNTNENFEEVTFEIVDGQLVINPINVTVTITGASNTTVYDGEEHTVKGYEVKIDNELYTEADFTFTPAENAVIVDGQIAATRKDVGTSYMGLTSDQFANTNKNFKTVTFNVTDGYQIITAVDEVVVTITEHSGEFDYDGEEHEVIGYDVEISNPLYTEDDFTFDGNDTVKGTDAGTYNMALKPENFTNTNTNFAKVTFRIVDGKLTIKPIDVTVTITEHSDEADYDGEEHEVTGYDVEIGNELYTEDDFTFSGKAEVTGTDAGSYDMELKPEDFENTNKNFRTVTFEIVDGKLTIKPIDVTVTITEHSGEAKYDGKAHEVSGYDVKIDNELYKETDFTFTGTDRATGTDAGKYAMELKASDFVNNNKNFANVTFEIVDGELEITKRTVTLTSADDEKVYDGKALTNDEVTVGGDGFAEGEGATYDVTGTQTEVGESKNTFTYTLNEGTKADNYIIETVNGTLKVTEMTDKVTVTITENSDTVKYDGKEHEVTGYTVEIDNELYTEKDFTFSGEASVVGTDAGTYDMELKAADFTNISKNFSNVEFVIVDGTLTITKRSVILTSADDEKVYDGTALTNDTVTVSGDDFAEGEGATYDVTGTQTEVGESENTFTYTLNGSTKADNYTVETVNGTLKVTPMTDKVTVTITENSGTEKYDGKEHEVTGYTVKIDNELYTEKDFTFSGEASVAGTDAGKYEMELKAADFTNISKNFSNVEFVIVDGTLTINKRSVILTSADDEKVYDGTALTNNTVTVTGDGFVEGEGATYDVTGTITEVGETANAFTYTLNEGTKAGNYTITTEEGTLKVTPVTDKVTVTITEHKGEFKYDGKEHEVTGYTVKIDNELYTEDDFTFSGNDTVKGTDAGTYEMELKVADFTNISKNFSNVEFVIEDGTLTITKRTVTLTSADGEKVYDGTALTKNAQTDVTVTGDGFATGEGAAYDITGTITDVGETPNAFTYTLNEGTKAGNYTITTEEGTLKITPVTDKVTVTITEHKGEFKYDGKEHEVTGYDVKIDNELYTEADFTFSGNDTVKETDAGTYNMELKAADFENISRNFSEVEFVIVDGTLEISKRAVTLTSADDEKVYDGTALTNDTVTVSGDGFAESEGASYDVTGTQTEAGESANTFTYTLNEGTKADNYDITVAEGTLTVTPVTDKVTVTVTGSTGEAIYDGEEHEVTGYTVEIDNELYTEDDIAFNGTDSAKGTDAGTYSMGLKAEEFENISKNFTNVEFVVEDGELTIGKRSVTLTSADDEKVYDGKALTNDEVTVSGDGFVEGEGAAYDVTGSQTDAGESANTFTYTLDENTNPDNYEITVEEGKLVVTPVTDEITVTITGKTGTETYDGTEKTLEGYTFSSDSDLYTEDDMAFRGDAEAKGINAGTYGMGLKAEDFENISQNFTNVKFVVEDGTLEIGKRDLTVRVEDKEALFNGEEQFGSEDVIFDGLVDGQIATVTYNASHGTKTGTYTNGEFDEASLYIVDPAAPAKTGSLRGMKLAKAQPLTGENLADNYNVKFETGDLTISGEEKAHLTISKVATSKPKDSKGYAVGETITWKITVRNAGNVVLTDITVEDKLTGDSWTIDSLAAGESKEFTVTYKVTKADAEKGSVVNEATATAKDPDGNDPTVDPGTSKVPTKPEEVPVPEPEPDEPGVKTGDDTNMWLWTILLAASSVSMGAIMLSVKKRYAEED